ncbi:MAG: ROK family protein [Firmicutes bacterium]|nr:ROK family protein [Bacillota bacterium]
MSILVIDIGGSSFKCAVMTEELEILKREKVQNTFRDKKQFLAAIEKVYRKHQSEVDGIAISYCGELDPSTGLIYCPGSYAYMSMVNLKEELEAQLKTTVWVEKDAICAGLAEAQYGVLKPYQNSVALILGSGLGCAVLQDHEVYHGAHFRASLATLQSTVLKTFMRKFMVDSLLRKWNNKVRKQKEPMGIDGVRFFQKVEAKRPLAIYRFKKFTKAIVQFIIDLQVMLDTEAIAIGGGVSAQPRLIEEIRSQMDKAWETNMGLKYGNIVKPDLLVCAYKNDANLIGAMCFYQKMKKEKEQ